MSAKMDAAKARAVLATCDLTIYEAHATIDLLRLTIQGMERGQVSYSGHFAAGLDSLIGTAQEKLETMLEALLTENAPDPKPTPQGQEGGAR